MAQLRIVGRPYSRIGTPAHTGPYARLRSSDTVRIAEAAEAWRLVNVEKLSIRQAADVLGMSVTTTWRRERWYGDWTLGPDMYGLPYGPYPHQRGTRACPNGRPVILPHDARDVFRQLLDDGVPAYVIAVSWRTVPKCIRDLADKYMAEVRERLDEASRARLDQLLRDYATKAKASGRPKPSPPPAPKLRVDASPETLARLRELARLIREAKDHADEREASTDDHGGK